MTIAVWFLLVDIVRGQPLYTPTVLGLALFQGGTGTSSHARKRMESGNSSACTSHRSLSKRNWSIFFSYLAEFFPEAVLNLPPQATPAVPIILNSG